MRCLVESALSLLKMILVDIGLLAVFALILAFADAACHVLLMIVPVDFVFSCT